jgi:hypothetical protein
MGAILKKVSVLGCLAALLMAAAIAAPQSIKLVVNDAAPNPQVLFAQNVALSGDGNTAILADANDNKYDGATWIFTRSNGAWTQQGPKLVGEVGAQGTQGYSLALASDGNTFIVGAPESNSGGSAWVFTRNGGAWSRQGARLGGTDELGMSVALSAHGDTAIVGGRRSAAFFIRSGDAWTPQGSVPVDSNGPWGTPVALSGDGNTAIVGAYNSISNNALVGASVIFTRSNGVWTQQGPKLVDSSGASLQGYAVALSGDGNTALVGSVGAAWVYVRNNGAWTQQGPKLVGSGAVGSAQQGEFVALSADGNTAAVGGPTDNNVGAVWIFTRSGGLWTQHGAKIPGSGKVGGVLPAGAATTLINGTMFVPAAAGN